MQKRIRLLAFTMLSIAGSLSVAQTPAAISTIQLGPRPYFLTADMTPGALKDKLQSCANGPF